jgi:hypothetical protein
VILPGIFQENNPCARGAPCCMKIETPGGVTRPSSIGA